MTTTDTPTLTDRQRERLLRPLNPARTQRNPAGFRYLEAWDVRRYLTRIFGFGGYSTDLLSLDLAHAAEVTPRRWVVVYRAAVKLTVYVDGREFGHWHGVATGAGRNLPVADAHDIAAKAADSGALKRAATNLGDQFGLSLYDGGSLDPVVLGTLVKSTTAPPEADTQVKPDPEETHPDEATTVPTTPAPTPAATAPPAPAPTTNRQVPEPAPVDIERERARREMLDAAASVGFSDGIAAQFEAHFGHPIRQGTTAEFQQARDLMTGGQ